MNRVLWANDYPHGDGIWPNSRTVLAKMAEHMSDEHLRMMVRGLAFRCGTEAEIEPYNRETLKS